MSCKAVHWRDGVCGACCAYVNVLVHPSDMIDVTVGRTCVAGRPAGADKWVFPDPILDELRYRQEIREVEGRGS